MKRNKSGQWIEGVSGNPDGRPRRDALELAKPVTPQIRRDGYVNPLSGHGTSRDRRSHTTFLPDIVSDDLARSLRRSNFLAKKIIEAEPEEAYRRGWKLKIKDQKIADDVLAWSEDVKLEERMIEARQKEREAGGAAIFPVIDGAQGDLAQPLDWNAIETVKAFHVLEPRELTPMAFYPSLGDRGFRMPSLYLFTPINTGYTGLVGYQAIHASRLVIFPGTRVSPQTEPGQRLGWGDSVLCAPSQVLADFGLSWGSAATLLHQHGAGMLEMDGYAELMATNEGEDQVWRRVGMLSAAMNAIRTGVIDAKDKFTRQSGTLSGLAETLNEFKVLMSAASDGMPVSVLFGQSQSGLRTGDDDTRTWYAHVEKRRAKHLKPRHEMCLRFRFRSADGETGGKEPDVWSVDFPSLWSPSDKEVAETRKLHMETFKMAIEAGVLSADDVAESLYGQDTYSPEIKVNWKRRREQAKIAEVAAADLQAAELEAMGAEPEAEPEVDDDELEAMAEDDDEEDEGFPDDDRTDSHETGYDEVRYRYRYDKGGGGGKGKSSGPGKGYNPYRAKDGKFAPGARKKESKAFNASEHKKTIATYKGLEHAERKKSLALKSEMAALRAKAKGASTKERAALRSQHAELAARRKQHQAEAGAWKAERLSASKQLQADRAAHAEKRKAERAAAAKAKSEAKAAKAEVKAEVKNAMGAKEYRSWQASSSSRLTKAEHDAMVTYSGDAYKSINGAHRLGEQPKGELGQVSKRLDAAIGSSRAPRDTLVYRGVANTSIVGHLRPGHVFKDKAFLSTTTNSKVAQDSFANGGAVFRITVPKGYNALPMVKSGKYPKEKEVMLGRDTRLHVTRVSKDANGTTIIHARAI